MIRFSRNAVSAARIRRVTTKIILDTAKAGTIDVYGVCVELGRGCSLRSPDRDHERRLGDVDRAGEHLLESSRKPPRPRQWRQQRRLCRIIYSCIGYEDDLGGTLGK
jgi:hypothetical protein